MTIRPATLGLLVFLGAAAAHPADDIHKLKAKCRQNPSPQSNPCVNLYAAIERLGPTCERGVAADCALLAAFAREAWADEVMHVARVASDPALLAEMARNKKLFPETRCAAIGNEHLKDQAVLAEIARRGDELLGATVAAAALEKITDQAVLAEIARSVKDDFVASAAIKRLTDAKVLAEIAAGTGQWRPRWARERMEKFGGGSTAVAGVLVEEVTGTPLAEFAFTLAGLPAVTDAQGRFRLAGVKAGEWPVQNERGFDLDAAGGTPKVQIPASGEAQVGTVAIQDGARAGRALGALCQTGAARPAVPAKAKLITLVDEPGGWRYEYGAERDYGFAAPWQGVLCISKSEAVAGTYLDKDTGKPVGQALTAIWSVRLVRLSDGQVFETRVSANPPKQTMGGSGATGDPTPKLRSWLSKIR